MADKQVRADCLRFRRQPSLKFFHFCGAVHLGHIRIGSNKSTQYNVGFIKWRGAHEVLVDAHNLAGTLYCLPEGRRHLQNLIGRFGLCNPCADLNVLFWGQ